MFADRVDQFIYSLSDGRFQVIRMQFPFSKVALKLFVRVENPKSPLIYLFPPFSAVRATYMKSRAPKIMFLQ